MSENVNIITEKNSNFISNNSQYIINKKTIEHKQESLNNVDIQNSKYNNTNKKYSLKDNVINKLDSSLSQYKDQSSINNIFDKNLHNNSNISDNNSSFEALTLFNLLKNIDSKHLESIKLESADKNINQKNNIDHKNYIKDLLPITTEAFNKEENLSFNSIKEIRNYYNEKRRKDVESNIRLHFNNNNNNSNNLTLREHNYSIKNNNNEKIILNKKNLLDQLLEVTDKRSLYYFVLNIILIEFIAFLLYILLTISKLSIVCIYKYSWLYMFDAIFFIVNITAYFRYLSYYKLEYSKNNEVLRENMIKKNILINNSSQKNNYNNLNIKNINILNNNNQTNNNDYNPSCKSVENNLNNNTFKDSFNCNINNNLPNGGLKDLCLTISNNDAFKYNYNNIKYLDKLNKNFKDKNSNRNYKKTSYSKIKLFFNKVLFIDGMYERENIFSNSKMFRLYRLAYAYTTPKSIGCLLVLLYLKSTLWLLRAIIFGILIYSIPSYLNFLDFMKIIFMIVEYYFISMLRFYLRTNTKQILLNDEIVKLKFE